VGGGAVGEVQEKRSRTTPPSSMARGVVTVNSPSGT
jgi:hypothetical protein